MSTLTCHAHYTFQGQCYLGALLRPCDRFIRREYDLHFVSSQPRHG